MDVPVGATIVALRHTRRLSTAISKRVGGITGGWSVFAIPLERDRWLFRFVVFFLSVSWEGEACCGHAHSHGCHLPVKVLDSVVVAALMAVDWSPATAAQLSRRRPFPEAARAKMDGRWTTAEGSALATSRSGRLVWMRLVVASTGAASFVTVRPREI